MKRTERRRGTVTKGVSDVSLASAIVRQIEFRVACNGLTMPCGCRSWRDDTMELQVSRCLRHSSPQTARKAVRTRGVRKAA